ncbi:MAG TPA: flippase [Rubricoccaceae bacterium]|nr:flippase [Rubricoccaceae bacterium]
MPPILRNLRALALARGATMVLQLVTAAYLARTLAPERFGYLGFGLALLAYFGLLVNFGLNTLGTREVARVPERVVELAGAVLGLRLLLALGAFVAYLAVLAALPGSALFRGTLAVLGLTLFGQALSVEWVYEGVQQMGTLALRNVAAAVLHLVGVIGLVQEPDDVAWAAAAAAGSVLAGNGWLLLAYRRTFGRLRVWASRAQWKGLFGPALPFAASAFMVSVYYHLDQIMLGLLTTQAEVGLYTAAYRLLTAALVPALLVAQAFFPALAEASGDVPAMRSQGAAFARTMFGLGLPAAVAGVGLAHPLLVLFAGEAFAPASAAFALLMANAALVYVNMAYGHPLLAWDRQRAYLSVVAAGAGLNAALNAFLIPRYGIEGAAAATLASEVVVGTGLVVLHRAVVGQVYGGALLRAAAATALGVGGPLLACRALAVPLALTLALIALGYAAAAWAFGLVDGSLLRHLRAPAPAER